jgi:hypothetical protein
MIIHVIEAEITMLVQLTTKARRLAAIIDIIAVKRAFCFVILPEDKGLKGRSFLSTSISK